MRTYEVHVRASALRIIKVRARDGADALAKAGERIERAHQGGSWVIDFPGPVDEHFSVYDPERGGLGPNPDGSFEDGSQDENIDYLDRRDDEYGDDE